MTDYQKALNKINFLVNKAKQYRDTKGYKENLGYDQQNKLEDFLSSLNITYTERCQLITKFYSECTKI